MAVAEIFSQGDREIGSEIFLGFETNDALCANVRETPKDCLISEEGEKVFDEC